MIKKPKNDTELVMLIGKTAVIEALGNGNETRGRITGVNSTKTSNPFEESEFREVFVYLDHRPKSYPWKFVKAIEEGVEEPGIYMEKANRHFSTWMRNPWVWVAAALIVTAIIAAAW